MAKGTCLGLALDEAAIARAKAMNARKVYIERNTVLMPALSLYEKLGFLILPELSVYVDLTLRPLSG